MCQNKGNPELKAGEESTTASSTCFTCRRLNDTTFLIVEEDKWGELPFIYIKVEPTVLVIIDTGCGGAAKDADAQLTSLREFIETYPVTDNGDQPLNAESQKVYIVICSHCHYDHIGAIAQFTGTPKFAIWASAYDKGFIAKDRLPTTSLCRFFGMETPQYRVTHWADDGQHVVLVDEAEDLGLIIYHTPGHTPDELAVWDPHERVIFVGDTLYEWAHIIFPKEGHLRTYVPTLGRLKKLVDGWNTPVNPEGNTSSVDGTPVPISRVKIACGHTTSESDAAELINDVDQFLDHILEGLVAPIPQNDFRDEQMVLYKRDDGKISMAGPKRLFDVARADGETMDALRSRHH